MSQCNTYTHNIIHTQSYMTQSHTQSYTKYENINNFTQPFTAPQIKPLLPLPSNNKLAMHSPPQATRLLFKQQYLFHTYRKYSSIPSTTKVTDTPGLDLCKFSTCWTNVMAPVATPCPVITFVERDVSANSLG